MKQCDVCTGMISNYPCPYCGHGEYEKPDPRDYEVNLDDYDEYDNKIVTEVKENGIRNGNKVRPDRRKA